MRRTKIVATVGPASSSPAILQELMRVGVDVFRLNFSHGTHDGHRATCRAIREAAAAAGRIVAVLQDLSGPKIRTGRLAGGAPLQLRDGGVLRIAVGDEPGSGDRVFTPYQPLVESARPGDRLLLDDGRIELRVTAARDGELETMVVNGGTLAENKGINAPGVALPASAVTPKDEEDLRFGLQLGVDLVALSFVQTGADVQRALDIMHEAGRVVPIIAKIERPAGVENFDEILAVANGVMVARGDLGLEMPLEQVPRVQREVIRRARAARVPVILATQVLESMRVEPRPTRAEVSDAANAVIEGVDAIMLAGETAAGAFPVRAVETLDAVIRETEMADERLVRPKERFALRAARALEALIRETDRQPGESSTSNEDFIATRHARALCDAAARLAETAGADLLVAVTRVGRTATLLSSLRPMTPVLAATSSPEVAAACSVLWGIAPMVTPAQEIGELEALLVARGLAHIGSVVVFVNVSAEMHRTDANFINVVRIA